MESLDDQPTLPVQAPVVHQPLPSLRLTAAVMLLAGLLAVIMTVGTNWGGPASTALSTLPKFRYVNSGWITPLDLQDAGAFTEELRAFVIVNQEELDAFQSGFLSKVSRGNATSLNRIDFDTSVLLAAYYVWRPVKGDPLSVVDLVINRGQAVVTMELDQDAQGREYAYLYAPMIMVAVERSLFPEEKPVEFLFELPEHPAVTLSATPN